MASLLPCGRMGLSRDVVRFCTLVILLGAAVGLTGCCTSPGAVQVEVREIGGDIRVAATEAKSVTAPMRLETVDGVKFLTTPRGDGTRRPTPQDKEEGGKATFEVDVPQAGPWILFGRFFWHDQGGTNSFWAKVDDRPYQRVGNDGPAGEWFYWKGPVWKLEAGKHTLTIREREWGARVAELFLSPVPDCVTRVTKFEGGQFVAEQSRVLIEPPYCLKGGPATFTVFSIAAGKKDFRSAAAELPLAIHDPSGKLLLSGTLRGGQKAVVTLPRPKVGKYEVQVGEVKQSWEWLQPRLTKLEASIKRLKRTKDGSADFNYWLPTLDLRHKNILRGFRVRHLWSTYVPSLAYVRAELDRAEQIAAALEGGDYSKLEQPGSDERAFYSDVDGELCPYVIYLPQAYFKSNAKFPLVMYLHGANGTQWEVHRGFDARGRKMADIRWPMIVPFARGNSGYRGPAGKDLIQMIRQATARYRIDKKRLVVAGYSMGGGGTWRVVREYPDMFEAAIPIAGGMPRHWHGPSEKPKVPPKDLPKDLRTRIFIAHSPDDKTAPFALAEKARKYLKERGIPFKFISYPGGHKTYPEFPSLINGLYK
jgi:predicted esterase